MWTVQVQAGGLPLVDTVSLTVDACITFACLASKHCITAFYHAQHLKSFPLLLVMLTVQARTSRRLRAASATPSDVPAKGILSAKSTQHRPMFDPYFCKSCFYYYY